MEPKTMKMNVMKTKRTRRTRRTKAIKRAKKTSKKGFYFTLDALLSSMLLITGLILISQHLFSGPTMESIEYLSTDALSALSTLRMDEINSTYVSSKLGGSSYTNLNLTVIAQIGTYWAANETDLAINLSDYVLRNLFPNNTGMNFIIETDTIFQKALANQDNLVTGGRMITGIMQGAPITGSTSFAYLRRIKNKRTNSFAYFGGFVGQGVITVRLDNLPSDISASTVREMFLEGEFDSDFNLIINGALCRFVNVGSAQVQKFNVTNCSSLLQTGSNTVTLNFTEGLTNASISGGLLGLRYITDDLGAMEESGYKRTYLPNIDGVINLYDGFMVPGTLIGMNISLHYWVAANVTLPIYFDIGSTTILTINVTGEQTYFLPNSYLDALLNYTIMSNTTVPFRIGFYDGNTTNSSGNLSDIFLLTSRHYSMSTNDIIVNPTTNTTRIQQAKDVDNLFVDIVLNASGNRLGLVSFGTGASVDLDSTLTNNPTPLHTAINAYVPHPTDAQRYLCGAMEEAKNQLIATSNTSRKRAVVLMTDGDLKKSTGNTLICSGSPTSDRSKIWQDAVKQACDFTDPVYGNPYNITFYTVAFGPEAVNDPAIIGNLTLMANCTGGKFASGNNASELTDIYTTFANELSASSIVFSFQRAISASNVESHLYGDSYIDISHEPKTPATQQSQIPITFQTNQFSSCNPTVNIPESVTVIEAHIVSYSGDYWTKRLTVNGTVVYNISLYGADYYSLGDPFQVLVPPELLVTGDHDLNIALGINDSTDFPCSMNNSLIYTGLVTAMTNRTFVLPSSEGCIWLVESEDIEFQNISVPAGYTGSKRCNYTNASIAYDIQDAYDVAVAQLLRQIDPDNDGRVSINFAEEDLEISVTILSKVPYLWGPTLMKIRVWQ